MFRNRLVEQFPAWFEAMPWADWPMHMLNARHGKIGYCSEAMAVHRVHRGGASRPTSEPSRSKEVVEQQIELLNHFNAEFDFRYDAAIRGSQGYARLLARQARQSGETLVAARHFVRFVRLLGLPTLASKIAGRLRRRLTSRRHR